MVSGRRLAWRINMVSLASVTCARAGVENAGAFAVDGVVFAETRGLRGVSNVGGKKN